LILLGFVFGSERPIKTSVRAENLILRLLVLSFLTLLAAACSKEPGTEDEFFVVPVAEKAIDALPKGDLFWRVETFSTLDDAKAQEGPTSLAAEVSGKAWLFTLGEEGGATPGGTKVAEIGPVPPVTASRYLLRVNHAGGPPGAKTPVHTHPGSEAFYVIAGELTQKTSHGVATISAGDAMNGHEPGAVMQLESSGTENLDQLVMFVVDAEKPFSSPAEF
jgi:quercetin dioxygenase-like cupin family protein